MSLLLAKTDYRCDYDNRKKNLRNSAAKEENSTFIIVIKHFCGKLIFHVVKIKIKKRDVVHYDMNDQCAFQFQEYFLFSLKF